MENYCNGGSEHIKQYFVKTFGFTQVDQTLLTYKRSNIFKYWCLENKFYKKV